MLMDKLFKTMGQRDNLITENDRLRDVILTAASAFTQEAQHAHKHDFLKIAIALRMSVMNGGYMPPLEQIEFTVTSAIENGLLKLTDKGYALTDEGGAFVKQHMPPVKPDSVS